jgi:hypothetical protein
MRKLLIFLLLGSVLLGNASAEDKATIFVFRRHFATLAKFSLYLNSARVAKINSGTFVSISVDPGTYRLSHDLNFHGATYAEKAIDVSVRPGELVCVEATMDLPTRSALAKPRFSAVPCTIARDHLSELHPVDRKGIFDPRAQPVPPDFP